MTSCLKKVTIGQSRFSRFDKGHHRTSHVIVSAPLMYQCWKSTAPLNSDISYMCINSFWLSTKRRTYGRRDFWKLQFALDTGQISGDGDQDNLGSEDGSDLGQTRLGRIVGAASKQLLGKLNSARKNIPLKIFLVLLGFYTANALATILGQTGDWDVLVAGVVVAAIEGIGMLMYKKSLPLKSDRLQSLITLINFWKAGVCLGLFVDAFKLGS